MHKTGELRQIRYPADLVEEVVTMKPILVFDLDDTLYDELSYVHSGFRVVAAYIADQFKADRETVLCHDGAAAGPWPRPDIRRHFGPAWCILEKTRPPLSVHIPAAHSGNRPLPEADACLDRFRNCRFTS
jgi:FMN phosphatase YigB (HAD superfamily)